MLKVDSDCLICDFAQTYHIYDLRALPLRTVAVLACGLGDDSRIKRKLSGQSLSMDTLLLARCSDILALILWSKCKPGTRRPDSILQILTGSSERSINDEIMPFDSIEQFETARQKAMKGGG